MVPPKLCFACSSFEAQRTTVTRGEQTLPSYGIDCVEEGAGKEQGTGEEQGTITYMKDPSGVDFTRTGESPSQHRTFPILFS